MVSESGFVARTASGGVVTISVIVGIALVARWWGRVRRERDTRARMAVELPALLDLILVGARSGLTLGAALDLAAVHSRSSLGSELRGAMAARRRGIPLAECLGDLGSKWGPQGRLTVGVLLASHHYGEPLVPALDRLATDMRARSAAWSESEARKLPTRMLLPLVFTVLPAFALLTVVPVLAEALGGM